MTIPAEITTWLATNAPAGWISAAVAISTLTFVLYSRKKPRIVQIRNLTKTSLVSVTSSIKNKINITYNGEPITTIERTDFSIINSGSETIQKLDIKFKFLDDAIVLDVITVPEHLKIEPTFANGITHLSIPYLNPYKDHKETIGVSIMVNGSVDLAEVTGSGEGWSTKYDGGMTKSERKRAGLIALVVNGLSFPIVVAYQYYIWSHEGVGPFDFSFHAWAVQLPGIAILLLANFFSIRRLLRHTIGLETSFRIFK